MNDIETLLRKVGSVGAFAVRRSVAPDDLRLEVRGVGPIAFPITSARARRLCAVARPARYGVRDQTVLDKRVRDTWEIARSRIKIEKRRWNETLIPELDRIRRELGLADGCQLRAELHNLLVYGPGQFFTAHQDTEKTDGMIGSLVVTLPSKFTGGAMVVEHHDEKVTSRGSTTRLSLVAFYADCHHEVRPIREGYRIALTYNLILTGDARVPVPERTVDELAEHVRKFHETPLPPSWSSDSPQPPPDRLVYLLDHQYTQKSLAWSRLKNADAARAAALTETARRLDCEIFLALADVHEMWSCVDEGYESYGYYYDEDEDEDEEEEDEDDAGSDDFDTPELVDLEDSDIELRHWIGTDDKPEAVSSSVSSEELFYTKPSVEFEPFQTEHEPYMGNWGNTVDRWYHRAAVVMWPRERGFVIRAEASASWAIDEIARTLRKGVLEDARRMAEQVAPFWTGTVWAERSSRFLQKTLRVAGQLDDQAAAAVLLRPFGMEHLTPGAAPQLAAILERYGLAWCRSILAEWDTREGGLAREAWLSSLPDLCRALCAREGDDGVELARWLLAQQWPALEANARATIEHESPSRLLDELAQLHRPVLALLESSHLTQDAELHAQILRSLSSEAIRGPVLNAVRLLRKAEATLPRQLLRSLGLGVVHAQCTEELTALLARAPRAGDDWSIQLAASCSCALCTTLRAFLVAPDQTRLEWPIAQAKRAHVHQVIDAHELPVSHTTRRAGRPFTLELEKTRSLFQQEANERKAWRKELSWLKSKRQAFVDGSGSA